MIKFKGLIFYGEYSYYEDVYAIDKKMGYSEDYIRDYIEDDLISIARSDNEEISISKIIVRKQ